MLILPIMGDQPRNAKKVELAGMALKISKSNLKVDDIVSKIIAKEKYRAADLIEIVLNTVKYKGVKDEN
ncbi:32650_t:CDS:2, partial [Racocetra persica]